MKPSAPFFFGRIFRSVVPIVAVAVVANSGAGVTGLAQAIFSAVQPLPDVSPFYDLFPAQLMGP